MRQFILNEPCGGVIRHANLLVPSKNEKAEFGFIIMEPEHTPPMSESNSIYAATVLLDSGMIQMQEPETTFFLEAPAGLIYVKAHCENGKACSIEIKNVPSYLDKLDVKLEVSGLGTLTVDTAHGDGSFVLLDAKSIGFEIAPDEACELSETGSMITVAANEHKKFQHPIHHESNKISFYQFTRTIKIHDGILSCRDTVAIDPGKLDRSPCGTGYSVRMVVLYARGEMKAGDHFTATSIIGSRFYCTIKESTRISNTEAILPTICGRAWITGTHKLMCDPDDPWFSVYRLADTWPKQKKLK